MRSSLNVRFYGHDRQTVPITSDRRFAGAKWSQGYNGNMSLTMYSPYDGQPVSVRPQDVGRAIRDGQGQIFYVLPTSDQQGHYASKTRHGSAKDEAEYRQRFAAAAPAVLPLTASGQTPCAKAGASGLWALLLAVLLALAVGSGVWWMLRC